MTFWGIAQIILFTVIIILIAKPIGLYLARVFSGERTGLDRALRPVEGVIYKATGVQPDQEMGWKTYTVAMLLFSAAGMLLLYAIERLQAALPFNPQGLGAVPEDLSWGTAASFTTNTNWQAYAGETTMSYLTQMAGLAYHNFVSAAVGIVLAVVLVRALARRSAQHLGNFWVDLTRCCLYILLPACLIGALFLVWQGVPQNLGAYTLATTLDGGATQTIAQGPVASQEVIKELGTNGGGFFNTNSAHPFENPTPFSNLFELVLIFALGAGLTYMFGRMVGDTRQGWAVLAVMVALFVIGIIVTYPAEQAGNPKINQLGVAAAASDTQPGGNMEGKDVRFGIANSALWAVVTTDASCGAVNSFLDSYTPLGGMVPMFNIQLGEIIFGGVGSGLYGMLVFVILAVFLAGLMVGRTPEYLGKKIERQEIKRATLAILILPIAILGFTALAVLLPEGTSRISNPGPHGFSQVLYAYTSSTGNNGSAFAGLGVNTPFYNNTTGLAQLIGRFLFIVPTMALAGALARKPRVAAGLGTFPTTGPLFVGLVVGVILIVGGLTYFPSLALGPIVEHFQLWG